MMPPPPRRHPCRIPRRTALRVAIALTLLLGFSGLPGCRGRTPKADGGPKIRLELDRLNAEGLSGPPEGLRALSYEFCIPARRECRLEVYRVDPSVQFMPGSPGRVGCGPDQVLCVGNTHQPDFRQVLDNLAALGYVTRIVESVGE